MRKLLLAILAAVLAACARDPLFPGTPRFSHEPGGRSRRDSTANPSLSFPPGEHVYLTAVRYPDGFAWEQDTCAVEGTVWIDLYCDGERISSIPAGKSVFPDMHRYSEGHLWSDCSSGSETLVFRDGEEAFRFEGREALRGFLIRDGAVHTLGQDRDGQGFTYRVDGKVIYRSETGTALGDPELGNALTADGAAVFYCCSIPSADGKEYRVMRGGDLHRSLPAAQGGNVFDFRYLGDRLYRIVSKPRKLVLLIDGKEMTLALQGGEATLWSRIIPWKGQALVLTRASGAIGKRYFLQHESGTVYPMDGKAPVSDVLVDGDEMGWLETDGNGKPVRFVRSDGIRTDIGQDGYLASSRCALLHGGRLYLALTGRDGTPSCLWVDGEVTEIPFNGCITSITVE